MTLSKIIRYRKAGYDQALDDVIYIINHKIETNSLNMDTLAELLESIKWVNDNN
jgi:hypothetical protein